MSPQPGAAPEHLDVKDLRVVVTGGGGGLGRVIAESFADAGAIVHVCDVSLKSLQHLVDSRPDITGSQADIADPESVAEFFERTIQEMEGLDVLVNNVGISGPTAPLEDINIHDWRKTLSVNLDGQYLCAKHAIPHMKKVGGGSITNIASTAGQTGYPLRTPYAASKWAVIGLTKSLAMELGPYGIRVNAVCPGSLEGERMDRVIAAEAEAKGVSPEAIREGYVRQSSMRSFISPTHVAHTVLFLSSQGAGRISGQALAVDGHLESSVTTI
jgi:NAD(P)-dependent dehydrogenase (short-subunit alcohol dehydrogenase family)